MGDNSLKNALIVLPVLAAIGAAGYLLFSDYHPSSSTEDAAITREVVGQVVYTENNVNRQFDNDVLWNKIENKNQVFNKDSIRTGQNSTAVIKLSDNTIVELSESSLIVLDKNQDSLSLRFKAGDLATKNSGKGVQINVNDSVIRGEGADIKIRSTENGTKTDIRVDKGKATVVDKSRKTAEINSLEEAGIQNGNIQEIKKIAVSLKTPENGTTVTTSLLAYRQPFTWQVIDASIKSEDLEISKTPDFLNSATQIYRGHQALSPNLTSGHYYWRVGWQDAKTGVRHFTGSRELNIGADSRLELVFPENDSHFDVISNDTPIKFQWKCQIPAKVFVLEIASSQDFKKIAATRTLAITSETVKELKPGGYFWRVRAFGEHNEELSTTAARTFSILPKAKNALVLTKPENNAAWDSGELLEFSWQPFSQASEYLFILTRDPSQKDIVKTVNLKDTKISVSPPAQGLFYWSVRAMTAANSEILSQSEVRKINFKIKPQTQAFLLISPKEKSVLRRESSDAGLEPVLFQWQILRKIPGPVTLTVSRSSDLKDPLTTDGITALTASVVLVKSGIYYWRLNGQPATGAENEVSDVGSFTLKVINQFEIPKPVEPADGASIELETANSATVSVKFSWTPMPSAHQYHIIVERFENKKSDSVTVVDRVIKDWKFSIPLASGSYSWSISALDADGAESGQSKVTKFDIVTPIEMDAPVLNQPVVK